MLVRFRTVPSGEITAEKPVGAACATHRPVSRARSRDEATCWVCRMVSQYEAPFVGFSRIWPPLPIASRAR